MKIDQKRCEAPWYSQLHKQWVIRHPDNPALIVARGNTEGDLKWDGCTDGARADGAAKVVPVDLELREI